MHFDMSQVENMKVEILSFKILKQGGNYLEYESIHWKIKKITWGNKSLTLWKWKRLNKK